MQTALKAGFFYFGAVFFAGFVLGALRVLFLLPRLGELASVSLELPLMLVVSWLTSRWATKSFGILQEVRPRLVMGGIAFALLMAAELALSILVFGRTVDEHFTIYRSVPGAIGLAGQLAFAAFPLLQLRQRI